MRNLTFVLASALAAFGVIGIGCSDNGNEELPEPGNGSSGNTSGGNASGGNGSSGNGNASGGNGSSGNGNASSGGGTSSGGSSSGSGGECTAKLRPDAAAAKGPFCPFVPKSGSSGIGVNCATGETCCNGQAKVGGGSSGTLAFDDSVCVSGGAAACPAPSDPDETVEAYECTEINDCASGNVCCILPYPASGEQPGSTLGTGTNSFQCPRVTAAMGTRCQAACGAGEWQSCQADSDCGEGQTCTLRSLGPQGKINSGVCTPE